MTASIELDSQWRGVTLNDVCTKITDGAHLSPKSVEHGMPMASVKDLTSFGITIDSCRQIASEDYHKLIRQGCQPVEGDVLIAKDGASALDTVCVVRKTLDVVLLSSVAILRPNKAQIIPSFLRYYLDSETTRSYMKGAFTTGAAIPRVVLKDFKLARIKLPPLPTQRKIAAILSAYDDLIENNLRRIKILEEMAQNLYREWFVKFRFPACAAGAAGRPSHQHARFTDSPLGRIPEGWESGVVNDLLSLKSGFAFKSSLFTEDGTYGLVTIKNVHDGLFVPDCTSRIADLPSNMPSFCHLSTGDVLLSLTGNIGRICLVYGTDYLLNQRVAKLVPKEVNNRAYIYFTFRQDEFQTKLSKIANGVAQQNLSPIETGKMQVVIPSKMVLADFAGICEPIVEGMITLFLKNTTLRRTRDLLLPRLISGEVDVSELDIAVPEEAGS